MDSFIKEGAYLLNLNRVHSECPHLANTIQSLGKNTRGLRVAEGFVKRVKLPRHIIYSVRSSGRPNPLRSVGMFRTLFRDVRKSEINLKNLTKAI